jgi:hypothetical protein
MAFAALGDYKVTFLDGHTVTARSNFLGLSEVEKRWPDETAVPVMQALAYSMWWYLDCPGDFAEFQRSVHLIEEQTATSEEDRADPTVPTVGAA